MSTAVLHDLSMPARLAPWPRASRTTLVRCLWLAALLHLWAVLWLGSAPEGTAPPGQGVQGRLNVTLRGPADDGLPARPPEAPLPQAGQAPADATPRLGGAVRDSPLPAEASPGAARLGPLPAAVSMPPTPVPLPPLPLPPLPLPPVPTPPAPAVAAPALPDSAAVPVPPPPAPDPVLKPLAPDVPMPAVATPAAALAAAPPQPAAALPALPQLAPLPAAPPPEGRLEAGSLRQLLPAPAAPLVAPAPVQAAALPPTALPALATGPVASGSPAAEAAAPAARPAAWPAPAADTGPRLGADVAVPATAASAPRPLNLELGRLRGGELSRHGTAGVLPVLPRPPETDKLAAEIEKAARTDCRTAHAGAGLLAVVPLVIDAARGKGCKW